MLSLAFAGIDVVCITLEGGTRVKLNEGAWSMVSEVSIFFQSIEL